jgi:basic membrane lipoprotein Med (substrate-binding protein (PBP1-ABC) superfamily)
MRCSAALLLLCLLAGCGGGANDAGPATTSTRSIPPRAEQDGLRIGVVGPLVLHVRGAVIEHGSLAEVAGDPLVVVSAAVPAATRVAATAAAQPVTHFALVGSSTSSATGKHPLKNLAGLVLRHDQAALLGGAVAGLVAVEVGATDARVAWVGPREPPLVDAFVRGVHTTDPGATVLRAFAPDRPAACKEAALGALGRGAIVVMARGGICADAAIAGAHQQNHPGLRLSDFELPEVAAAQIVTDAVAGVFHGGEDLVYGAASGAVAVRALDPRISSATAVRARAAAQQLAEGLRPSG